MRYAELRIFFETMRVSGDEIIALQNSVNKITRKRFDQDMQIVLASLTQANKIARHYSAPTINTKIAVPALLASMVQEYREQAEKNNPPQRPMLKRSRSYAELPGLFQESKRPRLQRTTCIPDNLDRYIPLSALDDDTQSAHAISEESTALLKRVETYLRIFEKIQQQPQGKARAIIGMATSSMRH
jgi:hypothetical protein